ncbi:TonB-dependent receptor domain-containing protein [Flavobacterium gawalongense]|uniref:TonB-dependent receptor n=1 Tax=Flavobacterium gawalongense TaxID=2594432 RepID=A0A553BW02_9FLAO|nr:TonB-dependent receptor [Flavobacterium gawalongense]TRX12460.1 TonB-dependent receptor [Flavobacterium gawalongense]TRX12719.1 TonB-dependent receptor [Flavobacterium gawalongense]TRX30492.1 TonB-dependent receptor [Flavobacterium gawalongense]
MRVYLLFLSLFFCSLTFAQNSISGIVTDSNNQPIPGANIKIVGETAGSITDIDGRFTLNSSKKPPFVIIVTSVGYGSQKVTVSSNNQKVAVKLADEETKLNEIVVSASRTPERVLESPVTIERMNIADIKKTASATFYDGLENLKEVQMNTSSLSFKSINTRGFATVANTRFMQLVDGMDNSSPLLNFVLGNMIGVSEIDVQSVELLPGASSALYGANAFNGILFMNSKSPFTSQGITAYAKFGQTSQEAAGSNDFIDYGVRMAHAFSSKLAGKVNFTYMRGTDWYATNYNDKTHSGIDRSNVNYDGINVYGDEVSTNIKGVGQALASLGLISGAAVNLLPNYNVSRTGYNEVDLTDNKASNTKIDFSLHYRPFGNENLEVIWQSKFGFGNAVYQGANRYYLNNFFMQQHKLEFKGKNFFVRGYTTTEDGGESYDMLFTGININRKWKDDKTWFGQYAGAYIQSTLAGMTPENAHIIARNTADTGRFLPGTPEFKAAFNSVIADPSVLSGSKLVDNSKIYHSDANYNFKDIIKFAEIQVGGSFRLYELNSHGRIYTDANGPINYNEYGAYGQLTKRFLEDRLKFTGSVRYDKSKNFDGSVSPRISLVYSGGESKKHNFRASFQTGFRNPSTQDQYIGFNVGSAILLGSAPDNLTRYSETLPVSTAVGQAFAGGSSVVMTGLNAYNNSYTASSVQAFGALAASDPIAGSALLRKTNVNYVKPEQVKAFELGYRSLIKDVSIDINGYYNIYNDFIGNLNVVAPFYGTANDSPNPLAGPTDSGVQSLHALQNGNYRAYQLYTNTNIEIKSLGFGLGLSKKVYRNFEAGVNYNFAEFNFDQEKDPSFEAGFNTPKHRVKASFGNEKLFDNFGFNISGRWNSEYLWQSTMVDGMIDAATVIDAQVNYNMPKLKSTLKLGASNIGGKEYTQVLGAGLIGHQYFASWTINP